MQRGFGGDFCLQNAKINHSKTLEKSIILGQNKNFFKILKKSVAKIVRLICATGPKIYAVFPSIGGCDRRHKAVCRYGPIEGEGKIRREK